MEENNSKDEASSQRTGSTSPSSATSSLNSEREDTPGRQRLCPPLRPHYSYLPHPSMPFPLHPSLHGQYFFFGPSYSPLVHPLQRSVFPGEERRTYPTWENRPDFRYNSVKQGNCINSPSLPYQIYPRAKNVGGGGCTCKKSR